MLWFSLCGAAILAGSTAFIYGFWLFGILFSVAGILGLALDVVED